jgi:hypothetical protein
VDNSRPLGGEEIVLIIAALLLIFGVVGRWDYDDAVTAERIAADVTARKLICEEAADKAVPGLSKAGQRTANYRLTAQAADVLVLRCIVVAD